MTNSLIRSVTSLVGPESLVLHRQESPAARLRLDLSTGRPVLAIHGVVGATYTIQQLPALFVNPPLSGMWWYLDDVTLTNSP